MRHTTVVNIKSGARYDQYIGRAGNGEDGYFGNPYRLIVDTPEQRAFTIEQFEEYFYDRLERDPGFKRRVHALRGKRLGCFCAPKPCHGDVIVTYLNG